MQNSVLKIILVFSVALAFPTALHAQTANPLLVRADSLFEQKRYIQSLELYQTLFDDHRYTPAMLLRMAYITEGLNNIAQSTYYLNLYYLATQDKTVPAKLEELAQKYRLEGYEVSESDKVISFYLHYHTMITLALAALLTFIISFMLTQRLRFKQRPVAAFVCLVIFSAVFIVHINSDSLRNTAIISKNNTYIMSGPSAGASVIAIVRDGHRVSVTGKNDVWTRVAWGDTEAYIKQNNLLPVKL